MPKSNRPNPIPQPQGSNAPPNVDEQSVRVVFPTGTVVASAQPISMVSPVDRNAPVRKKGAGKRRTFKDPTERPGWLPEEWGFEAKVRTSGATRGMVDRYYYDPSGVKFRSEPEVMHFLETGNKLKRKLDSKGVATSSASPLSKQQKSNAKSKNPQPKGV